MSLIICVYTLTGQRYLNATINIFSSMLTAVRVTSLSGGNISYVHLGVTLKWRLHRVTNRILTNVRHIPSYRTGLL